MESLLRQWDGESVFIQYDQPCRSSIIIAIHSTLLGPATGGTRMKSYADFDSAVEDALRLAAGMTLKFAVPNLNHGGGKAVIAVPPNLKPEDRVGLLRRYGHIIHQLGGLFFTGPDVGTSSADMDIIAETGAPYVFSRSQEGGGAGSPGPFTALGVFSGIQAAWNHISGSSSLAGCRILVQGTGSVGSRLIELLLEAGAHILFSEVEDDAISHYRDNIGLQFVKAEDVYSTTFDIFAPCALGGLLNAQTIPQLSCRAVAGGANNQLALIDDAQALLERGILYAPDYVINVGGAMAITGIEVQGWTHQEAKQHVKEAVQDALAKIFMASEVEGITTEAAARILADNNLTAAAAVKTTSITE